jgi:hypothetical protein
MAESMREPVFTSVGSSSFHVEGGSDGVATAAVVAGEVYSPFRALAESGYIVSAKAIPANTRPVPRHPIGETNSPPPGLGMTSTGRAILNAREAVRQHWQREGPRVHWIDRDSSLASERNLAIDLLQKTAYSPDLVERSRPYKSHPINDPSQPHAFQRPPTRDMLAKEQRKFEAAKEYSTVEMKHRAQLLRASHPEDYFGGR